MNDVIQIVSLLLNLLLGGGLIIQFMTIRSIRREATARAESASAQAGKEKVGLVDETVRTMVETVNGLMAQNKELIDKYSEKGDEVEVLKKEKYDLEHKITSLEKRVNRMIQTNLRVIKVLEQIGVDEEVIAELRSEQ